MQRIPKGVWLCLGILVFCLAAIYISRSSFVNKLSTSVASSVSKNTLTLEEGNKQIIDFNQKKEYQKSVEISDSLIKKYPNDYNLLVTRSIALYGVGKCSMAVNGLMQASELYPTDEYAKNLLATMSRSPDCLKEGVSGVGTPLQVKSTQ